MYEKQQQLMDTVCEDIRVCIDMVGEKDASKASVYGFVPGMNNMDIHVAAMKEQIHKLREGIFQVLFTGGFSAGKSTLLNALMGKDLLKTSINAETAVITKIIFHAEEKVIVYKKQVDKNGQAITEEYTIERFFKEYRVDQECPERFEDIEFVQLQQLQDGIGGSLVQLVDSPGTSNSEIDTEMARSFARKASAIVFLINATMPFTDEDKKYIKAHFSGQGLRNLFFVVNRFDSVQPQQIAILKENVERQLHDVFTVNDKFDRALFESRVFYTNAFGSLNTRLGVPTPTYFGDIMIDDAKTGVPEFESALGRFLTDDNRDKDALAAYVPKLATIFAVAKSKIAEEMKKYAEGKEKLERDRDELDAAIVKIQRILNGIEQTCTITAAELVNDIKKDYDSYVSAVESGWSSYFDDPSVMKGIKFNTLGLIALAMSKDEEKKKERIKPIQEAIEAYVKSKESILSANITQTIQAKTVKLENSLKLYQDQLENLDCPININDIMESIFSAAASGSAGTPDIHINAFQLILGIVGADPEIALGAINGTQSNMQAVVSSIVKNVLEYIALYVVAWPLGLAMLAARAWQMIKGLREGGNTGAKKLIEDLKPQVITELRNGKSKVAMDMEKKAGGSFIRAGQTFSNNFRMELDGQRKSFDDMIENLGSTTFNISQETDRTTKLLEEMVCRISEISQVTTGQLLTEKEILAKSETKLS